MDFLIRSILYTGRKFSPNLYLLSISTLLSILSVYSTNFGSLILKWLKKPSKEERLLLDAKYDIISQQRQISVVGDFVQYSRFQRKINVINQELEEIQSKKATSSLFVQLSVKYGVKAIFLLIMLGFSVYFRNSPVFYLGGNIDLTPFSKMISYPNGFNAVSVHFWVLCCSSMAKLIKK